MKTPITKARLKQHKNYSWWKYILLIAAVMFGWNLIFTTTAYRPPAEKKVDLYIATGYGLQDELNAYLENIRVNEMPDMEEMYALILTNDEYYSSMQLTTYIAAGEGDIYLLPSNTFRSYAAGGTLMSLDNYPELKEQADAIGIPVDKGIRTDDETHETHLFGIPAAKLTGFNRYGVNVADSYLCILVTNGNDDNSALLLSKLLRDMQPEAAAQ